MDRRIFLKTAAFAAASALAAPFKALGAEYKIKITALRVRKIRLIKELGTLPSRPHGPVIAPRVGGDTFIEIQTSEGITGIGPGVSPAVLARANELLIGKDPFAIEDHAYALFDPEAGSSGVEVALWDLIGKIVNLPLYKLWGGTNNALMPYASQRSLGTPAERARMAQTVRNDGWRAIKYRSHFQTLKEDVALVELTRKAMGPDFHIMCDANQAGNSPDGWSGGLVRWDVKRALNTAKEYERLDVYWLEEPLPRWDFEGLAEVSASTSMLTAGGEGNKGLHEFRWMLEQGVFDIMQPEVGLVGPSIARRIAALAAARDKFCVCHVGNGLSNICAGHLAASWTNTPKLGLEHPQGPTWEIFYEPPVVDINQMWTVFETPLVLNKATGEIHLNDAPGLGMTYKKDLIEDA